MAKLVQSPVEDEPGAGILALDIRPWVMAAYTDRVAFVLDKCVTPAASIAWVEVIYSLNDVPLHYTRCLVQMRGWKPKSAATRLLAGETDHIAFFSDCPFTNLRIRREDDEENEAPYSVTFRLDQEMQFNGMGESSLTFVIERLSAETVRDFADALDSELAQTMAGHAPAGEEIPEGYAVFPFGRILNRRAYDAIGLGYRHDYFADEFFEKPFAAWLENIPQRAQVLDIGCGHGLPVSERLADLGLEVTGIDISPVMLAHARRHVPTGLFRKQAAAELTEQAVYAGACSFFSLLHMDPIELRAALQRIHAALQPGAMLLVISAIPDINTRTGAFSIFMGQPVWQWRSELSEIIAALTERENFAVINTWERVRDSGPDQPWQDKDATPAIDDAASCWSNASQVTEYAILARKL
ncbi:MAG: class I SAM-dependent methyltransferase [Caldilineaceae bacterium]